MIGGGKYGEHNLFVVIGSCLSNSIVFVANGQTPPPKDVDAAWSIEDVSDSNIGGGR